MPNDGSILRRIARALGGDHVADALIRLAPRDLQSLLLHVVAERAARATPTDVLARYEESNAARRGIADPRALAAFALDAFDAAHAFDAWPLSPVLPLGAARALAGIHPNNVLGTVRPLEVLSDPTIAFALEAAHRRRRADSRAGREVHLAGMARVMRMQPLKVKGLSPHFVLFALATAGREPDGGGFAHDTLRAHLSVHLDVFGRLSRRGYRFEDLEVSVSDVDVVTALIAEGGVDPNELRGKVKAHDFGGSAELLASHGLTLPRGAAGTLAPLLARLSSALRARAEALESRILAPLARAFPEARMVVDFTRLEGLGYYAGPCVRVSATAPDGARFPLVDGGSVPWTRALLADQRERFVTSGVGPDLVCARFAAPSPG